MFGIISSWLFQELNNGGGVPSTSVLLIASAQLSYIYQSSVWAQTPTHEHPQILIPPSCSHVSVSPQTQTDSVRTRLVSLIYNSQFRCTEQNGTEPPAKSRSGSRCSGTNPLVSQGMPWSLALEWLALVHTWLWWLRWTMLTEFV